jgi:tetratricopeptide (TPR) repeat protein
MHGIPMIIGRNREFSILGDALRLASAGFGNTLVIEGEPGVGKSTLINAFLSEVSGGGSETIILTSRCGAISGEGEPLQPFKDIVSSLATSNGIVNKRKHVEYIKKTLPTWVSLIPIVGNALSTIIQSGINIRDVYGSENQASTREKLFDEFIDSIKPTSKKTVVVIYIDDIQWIDSLSISLLFRLVREIKDKERVLLLATMRTLMNIDLSSRSFHRTTSLREFLTEVKAQNLVAHIQLEGIRNRADVQSLLEGFFPGNKFSSQFIDNLITRTGGNPLFLNSIINEMITQGKIKELDNDWFLDLKYFDTEIPSNLEEHLKARLNNLDNELRNVCNCASVEGYRFTYEVVARVLREELNFSELQLAERVAILENTHRVIKCEESTEPSKALSYSFIHGLLQEILYKELSPPLRRIYHKLIAYALEAFYQDNPNSIASSLAEHFYRGGEESKASEYFYRAGCIARSFSGYKEALTYLNNAIKCLGKRSDEPRSSLLLADCYQLMGHCRGISMGQHDEALELYKKAFSIRDENKDFGESYVDLLHNSAICYLGLGDFPQALILLDRALNACRQLQNHFLDSYPETNYPKPLIGKPGLLSERLGNIIRDKGVLLHRQKQLNLAEKHLLESMELLKIKRDTEGFGNTCFHLAFLYLHLNRLGEAEELLQTALEIHREDRNYMQQMSVYMGLSKLEFQRSDSAKGFTFGRQARELGIKYKYYFHLCNLERFLAHRFWENNNSASTTRSFISALSFGYLANTFEYKRTIGVILLFVVNNSNSTNVNCIRQFLLQLGHSTNHRYQKGLAPEFEEKIWVNTENALTSSNLTVAQIVQYLAVVGELENFFKKWGEEYQEEEVIWQLSLSS